MSISDWSSDVCSSDLHPTDYDVERNKKSLRQRLLQQFVDDFRIRLATHSLHCLTNEKAEERFLAAAILLNFFGIGGQHIGDDLFDRPSIEIGRAPCREGVCTYV